MIRNIFKNTIYPDDINIDVASFNTSAKNEFSSNLGFLPFVWYGSYQIDYSDIDFFKLGYSDGVPYFKIIFYDTQNLMRQSAMPLDNTKIKVFLNPRDNFLKPIFLEFKIIDISNMDNMYTLSGLLDVNDIYVPDFSSYKGLSSYDSLKEVAKKIGFGFNSNVEGSSDVMNWINTGNNFYNFINYVLEHSYISDYSFISGYIDFYYNINYVDIEAELNRDNSEDFSIITSGLEESLNTSVGNSQDTKKVSNFISNDISFSSTNNFISEYNLINNSTNVSLKSGYLTKTEFYDVLNKAFLFYDIDSLTKDDGTNLVPKSLNDTDFYNRNLSYEYSGRVDSDNLHINYDYAKTCNSKNLKELEKFIMKVFLPTPNFNIYKFQKIEVIITNQATTPSNNTIVNYTLSGGWIVGDVEFIMDNGSFYQLLTLFRRDLSLRS